MSLDTKKLEYTAKLANLEIENEDKENFIGQMKQIIEYFEKLNELDTTSIEPTYNVLGLTNALREDIQKDSFSHAELFQNAPKRDLNFFCVPTTVEKKSK